MNKLITAEINDYISGVKALFMFIFGIIFISLSLTIIFYLSKLLMSKLVNFIYWRL